MDQNYVYNSPRTFAIWGYESERMCLLLRSSLSEKHKTTIDIIFWDIYYVELPRQIKSIEIKANVIEDLIYFESKTKDNFILSNHFTILSGEEKFFVSAIACTVYENELEFHESFFRAGSNRKGKMLVQY